MKKTADFLWGIALSIAVAISGIFNHLAFAQTNPNSGGSGGYNGSAGSGGSNNSGFYSFGGSGPTKCGTPSDYHWKKPLSSGAGLAVNVNLGSIIGGSYELDRTTHATTAEIHVALRAYENTTPPVLCANNSQVFVNSLKNYYAEFSQKAETSCDSSEQGSFTGGSGSAQIGQSFSSTCGFSVPHLLWEIMCEKKSYTRSDRMTCTTTVESPPTGQNGEALDRLFEAKKAMCRNATTKEIFLRNLKVFADFALHFQELVIAKEINLNRIHQRPYLEEIVNKIQQKYVAPPPSMPANCYRNWKSG